MSVCEDGAKPRLPVVCSLCLQSLGKAEKKSAFGEIFLMSISIHTSFDSTFCDWGLVFGLTKASLSLN